MARLKAGVFPTTRTQLADIIDGFKKDYVKPDEVKVNTTKKTDAEKRKDT